MSTIAKTAVALVVLFALGAAAYLLGVNSTQDEIRAAERRADALSADLKDSEETRAEVEEELAETGADLADTEQRLAECDGDRASEIFLDLLASQRTFLNQYNAYLNNDDLVFIVNWNALDRHMGDYSGRSPMPEQFAEALDSCTYGSGTSA
jgi:hypothetical protein